MCNGPKYFGFDFNGDGNVSFEESYLTYRISEDVINNNNDDRDDYSSSSSYSGSSCGSSYSDSYDDFDGDDF
jgi:hypothetical protein